MDCVAGWDIGGWGCPGELVEGGNGSGARPMPGCLEGAKVADNGDTSAQ